MCPRPRLHYIATIHQTTYAQGGIVKSIANPHDQTKAGRCILIVSPYHRRPEGGGAAVNSHCSSQPSARLPIGRAGAAPLPAPHDSNSNACTLPAPHCRPLPAQLHIVHRVGGR